VTRAPLTAVERLAVAGLVAQQLFVIALVPESPLRHLDEPVYLATLTGTAVALALVALRLYASRRVWLEKLLLAAFLGGMPIVYTWTALRDGGGRGAIEVELVGVAVFGALALAGWFRSGWFFVIGIAGHGLAWDLWHHGCALVVPGWYALGCLVADVALALYTATQTPRIDGSSRARGQCTSSRAVASTGMG
jgi:hypothetical protein